MKEERQTIFPSIIVLAGMALLAAALGSLLAGLRGLQAGCVAGLAIALLPFLADRVGRWLTRPDGLPRFVAREIGHAAISAATPVLRAISAPFVELARLLHGPAVLALVVGSIVLDYLALLLDDLYRVIATPLGLANLAALLVIMIDQIGLSFSPLAIGVGLIALVLALLVTLNEEDSAGLGR
ncbi:hypothetical protein SAMN02745126_04041 [Enhydrobacter aerosaccus]|uniref:Uncharacterized protein n=1 Tax=Enhydrobacter aerosaccus TaxID=225324 RepID=A0A1T4RR14_9HYPH|nr:hypothetical protein [Enhydrobacter aerosaccus]SKA18404.1 hypothetical protein SAMN02745126_04041 [Enhydrobacter aerosaccus]